MNGILLKVLVNERICHPLAADGLAY